jgi:hypothetical protein
MVKDWIRLWQEGARDLVMELCCARQNFRVRLSPWQPMVESRSPQLSIGARIPHHLLERAFHLMQVLWDDRKLSLDVPQGLIRLVERRNNLAP